MIFSALLLTSGLLRENRPNIIVILADDIGYGDLSCYGAVQIKTPNLDYLASKGVRFTDAHSASTVCTPSRYSLLTGESPLRNPAAAGIIDGEEPLTIKANTQTLPSFLQKNSYSTGFVGKWHLGLGSGPKTNYSKPIDRGTNQVGFEYSFYIPATGDRVPCVFIENDTVVNNDPNDPVRVSYRQKIGSEPTGVDNPELLTEPMMNGHTGTIHNGISRMGYMTGGRKARWKDDQIAETLTRKAVDFIGGAKSKPFFLYFATHDVHAPQVPAARFRGKSKCGLRGDTILQLDWSIGEITKALKRRGIEKDTIVMFSSDNGGANNDGYSTPRTDLNGHLFNGVLRGEKYGPYEGGHRVPMIVSWQRNSEKKRVSSALISHTDFFRSVCSQIGLDTGKQVAADSQDHRKALFGGSNNGRSSLVYHIAYQSVAYRSGQWVIIPNRANKFELYDLSKDLPQKANLADMQPQTVSMLQARLAEELSAFK